MGNCMFLESEPLIQASKLSSLTIDQLIQYQTRYRNYLDDLTEEFDTPLLNFDIKLYPYFMFFELTNIMTNIDVELVKRNQSRQIVEINEIKIQLTDNNKSSNKLVNKSVNKSFNKSVNESVNESNDNQSDKPDIVSLKMSRLVTDIENTINSINNSHISHNNHNNSNTQQNEQLNTLIYIRECIKHLTPYKKLSC